MLFRSTLPYTPALRKERPTYGKRGKPAFSPRIAARRKLARIIWSKPSYAPYRIMMLRRLWK